MFVMKSLLRRIVEMIESTRINNLLHTKFLYFFSCIEAERNASDSVFDGVFVKSASHQIGVFNNAE